MVIGVVLTIVSGISLIKLNTANELKYESPSETFSGVVSKESYNSEEETVKAFFENELSNSESETIFLRYERINKLSKKEIGSLAIEDDIKDKVDNVENINVYYTCDNLNKKAKAYLIKTAAEYRYYVPLSDEGDALTNSYLDSVLDGSKYLNSTATTVLNMRVINSKTVTELTYYQTITFDDDKALFDQELPGLVSEIYFTDADNGVDTYIQHPVKKGEGFYKLSELNSNGNMKYECYITKAGKKVSVEDLSSIKDITDFAFMLPVDASYFTKTSYGFKMTDEKYKAVCQTLLDDITYEEFSKAWDEYHIYFNSEYYVTEGRLSAQKTVLTMSDGEDIFAVTITTSYTDFGTTEVVLPDLTEK